MRMAIITSVSAVLSFMGPASLTTASTSVPAVSKPCITSDLHGNCGPYSTKSISLSNGYNTYVSNNGWACGTPGSCGPQKLTSYGPNHWSVASRQAAGNTAVLTYPDVQQIFTNVKDVDPPISSFRYIYSRFRESMPAVHGLIAEAGYDIWLSSTKGPDEIMIWVDNVGRGTGGARQIGNATIKGQAFRVLEYGDGEIIFSLRHNEQSGTAHILTVLRWLQRHGYVSANARIGQIDFGWEICSTGGHLGTFSVRRYTLQNRR